MKDSNTIFKNKVIQGDSIELMNEMALKGEKVNLVLTSPPYNSLSKKGDYLNTKEALKTHTGRYDIYQDSLTDDEYREWTLKLFENIDKVLEKNGVVIYNMSYSTTKPGLLFQVVDDIIEESNFNIVDTIVWKKSSAIPNNMSRNRLTRIYEFVFIFSRKGEEKTFQMNKPVVSKRPNGQNNYTNIYNYIEAINNDGTNEFNKATFSSDLVVKLLDIYALKDDTVLDIFMGTGTTAIGCMRHNKGRGLDLSYVGFELSENQVKYANKRIEEYKKEDNSLWGRL